MKKTVLFLALAGLQAFASDPVTAGLQPQHSALGRLTMVAPAAFKPFNEPGAGRTEIASQNAFFVNITASPMLATLSGGKAPSKAQVAQILSLNGPSPDLELTEATLDGHPGVMAKTTRMGTPKPQWTVIFFGVGGLQIEAQGGDALPVTKQLCEQVLASVKFDH